MHDAHEQDPSVPAQTAPQTTAPIQPTIEPSVTASSEDFVPPFPPDRWAHRRGEPRVFALLWTMFLLVATMGMLGSVIAGGVLSFDVYRPAARILLVVAMVGAGVLWPMTRLCQDTPLEGGRRAAARDVLVILLPLQAIIWPQYWLAAWPLAPLSALALAMLAWVLLIGGGLAVAMQGLLPRAEHVHRQEGRRTAWMLVALFLAFAALPLRLIDAPDMTPAMEQWSDLVGVLSPIGAVLELCHDRAWSGSAIAVSIGHWAGIGVVFAAAASTWLIAWGSRPVSIGPPARR